jgi:Cu2+-exporting ATPase
MNHPDHHIHGAHDTQSETTLPLREGAHDRHAGHSVAMFRDRFWLSFALTVPILIWGHMLPELFGYMRSVRTLEQESAGRER